MTWVWLPPPENNSWGAEIDYKVSYPLSGGDSFSDVPLGDDLAQPVYRSPDKLAKFRALHCPPYADDPATKAKEPADNTIAEAQYFINEGFEWGGFWTNPYDPSHFQDRQGYHWNQLMNIVPPNSVLP
jgi:D-alanyl-D-alanine carboxypeptidase